MSHNVGLNATKPNQTHAGAPLSNWITTSGADRNARRANGPARRVIDCAARRAAARVAVDTPSRGQRTRCRARNHIELATERRRGNWINRFVCEQETDSIGFQVSTPIVLACSTGGGGGGVVDLFLAPMEVGRVVTWSHTPTMHWTPPLKWRGHELTRAANLWRVRTRARQPRNAADFGPDEIDPRARQPMSHSRQLLATAANCSRAMLGRRRLSSSESKRDLCGTVARTCHLLRAFAWPLASVALIEFAGNTKPTIRRPLPVVRL